MAMSRKPARTVKSGDILWKDYFKEPSKWWDNRSSKVGPSYPDFKHKVTKELLWIDGWYTPSWVRAELERLGVAQAPDRDNNDDTVKGFDEVATFVASLKACAKHKHLSKGSRIHDDILKRGLLEKCSDVLVTMYAKCNELEKAKELLDMHKSRDAFTWTAIIQGLVQKGQIQDAVDYFERMKYEGLSPNAVTFACILKAYGNMGLAQKGKEIHDEVLSQGLLAGNILLGTALIDMYAKCGALSQAQQVLEELPVRDVVSWNALISGYANQGQGEEAWKCFSQMQRDGLCPDEVSFICILKACGSIQAAERGEQVHEEICKQGLLEKNHALSTALVNMYSKCGALRKAEEVLERLHVRDVVSWSALIAGYAEQGEGEQALSCYGKMQCDGLSANSVTFIFLLKACGSIRAVDKGEKIHHAIAKEGLLAKDVVLSTALVDMYAKCGALKKAQEVLEQLHARDVIAWNALIAGYAQDGQSVKVVNCLERMQSEGLSPNGVTLTCVLKACGIMGAADKGEEVHDEISRQGLLECDPMLGNALVDMYVKCGNLDKARQVLEELSKHVVVSWSSLIAGYAQEGKGEEALECFEQMGHEGLCPDAVTFASILKACGKIGAVDRGEKVHNEVVRRGLLQGNLVLGTALVDMYATCGTLDKAQRVLEALSIRDVVSWSTLIAGYAQNGQTEKALSCFESMMQVDGLSPDAAMFSSVLSACSILGRSEEAAVYFCRISATYGMKPALEHYTCMADLFGRTGHLSKAVQVIEKLPSSDSAVWSALLGACHKWGDVNVGRWAFEHAVQLDECDVGTYIIMADIYTAAGMQDDAEIVETMRTENEVVIEDEMLV